ncbi:MULTISPECIES: alpha/beta fold hydrolase [unclassified Bacillus (in: firmicutes)]|uniref:alpha/beta fold hydrolase n=1 Tax=unclassified Bacillus (in: firmicutes) TaxID=185979 RepID=UPI0008EF46EA|nr:MULTISPECIES: alpha/beta hydrolase [unclassified Bacillus (in: firmicutes)]SFI06379.1 Pimeloyl-ACP methyl ester carboxylesterase [Bacillus sp. 71mf]SFS78870.1 Pimeloyl-ACP methyl ester carboxylesterase [Bacillus sp. 103mf]
MSEKIFEINGINICTESFGNPSKPAVLLINGATNSMVYWDKEFCQKLADTGRYVIRYDNRDVGRSITYEPGTSNYTVVDMANDATGVIDAYNINQAHIVGMSLGGMIAQVVAFHNPQRVLSMTLISSSLFGSDDNDRGLPEMDESLLAYHAKGAILDWSDEESIINYLVEGAKMLCGSHHTFDEKRARELTTQDFKRANNLLSMFNHATLVGNDYYEGKIKEIKVPSLVIHGTEDTILPYEHGLALAKELPNASLLTLEGTGHEIHFDDWDKIINAISSHTSVK